MPTIIKGVTTSIPLRAGEELLRTSHPVQPVHHVVEEPQVQIRLAHGDVQLVTELLNCPIKMAAVAIYLGSDAEEPADNSALIRGIVSADFGVITLDLDKIIDRSIIFGVSHTRDTERDTKKRDEANCMLQNRREFKKVGI